MFQTLLVHRQGEVNFCCIKFTKEYLNCCMCGILVIFFCVF
jgi:hypothetical protein